MEYAAIIFGTKIELLDVIPDNKLDNTYDPYQVASESEFNYDVSYETDEHYEGFVVATARRDGHVNNPAVNLNYSVLSFDPDEIQQRFGDTIEQARSEWTEHIDPLLPDDVEIEPEIMLIFDWE